jgi:hypothetical protein
VSYGGKRHAGRAQPRNKLDACDVLFAIQPMPVHRARHARQHARPFVKAQGIYRNARGLRAFLILRCNVMSVVCGLECTPCQALSHGFV